MSTQRRPARGRSHPLLTTNEFIPVEPYLPSLYPDIDLDDTQVDPINPDHTVLQRTPRCTITGMPPPMHLPARPASRACVASYVARYPPVADDVIVVDMDFDSARSRAEILAVTRRIEIAK